MELKDKILLQTPDKWSTQPHKLDGGASEANLSAIRQLRIDGFVSTWDDSNGGFISFELTDLGKLRKAELVGLQNRSVLEKGGDAIGRGWRFVRPSLSRIVEGVIIAVLSGIVCFWLGRVTATNIADNTTDNNTQEPTNNTAIHLD